MPTTPGQPGEKIYRTPQPPENDVSRGGFTQTRTPTAPPPAQERRAVSPEQHAAASQVGGAGGREQAASGRIPTDGPGRVQG